MSFFFDYIFYRVNQFFFKRDGRTGARAVAAVTGIQLGLLINILLIIYGLINGTQQRQMHWWEKPLILAVAVGVGFYNYRRYEGKFNRYRTYWKEESKITRLYKGLLVILSIIIPYAILVIIGFYYQNK